MEFSPEIHRWFGLKYGSQSSILLDQYLGLNLRNDLHDKKKGGGISHVCGPCYYKLKQKKRNTEKDVEKLQLCDLDGTTAVEIVWPASQIIKKCHRHHLMENRMMRYLYTPICIA